MHTCQCLNCTPEVFPDAPRDETHIAIRFGDFIDIERQGVYIDDVEVSDRCNEALLRHNGFVILYSLRDGAKHLCLTCHGEACQEVRYGAVELRIKEREYV